jgi:transcriptional regulator with XRE-family HTH domain
MVAATISSSTPAPPPDGQRSPDQMIATTPPSDTEGKSRFRIARERRNLTQQQLADYCEVSLKSIKRYDAGGRVRDIEIAQRLAEVLDQPLYWLWPPDDHLQVRVARANHPDATPDPPATPDPHEVLATLHRTRPRLRRRARWLASAIALATIAAITTAVVLATTGHKQPAATPTSAPAPGEIAPILTAAAPPLLAASAVETTDDHQASRGHRKQRAHASRRHHRSAPSQRRATHSSGGSSSAAFPRTAQPVSTTRQAVAPTATASTAIPASSTPAKRQPAAAGVPQMVGARKG